ncbi:MAG TPA: chromate efflux transporter [Stellaceae bacterium]|nr:chromate efflux transporter [Stellaceae bacterium]
MSEARPSRRERLGEITTYFLKLGALGFGGPVALVGQMERDLVAGRGWLDREQMREAVAVCQTMPGPLAIQVGIYLAYLRGGQAGAWLGGWAFILPNFVMVTALAAAYVAFGGLPWMTAVFYGVSPAVIALILHSTWRLARLGMEDRIQWMIAAAAFITTVVLQAEVAVIFLLAGALGAAWYRPPRGTGKALMIAAPTASVALPQAPSLPLLGKILAFFLKAGSLTFGSGLVIVPFLEQGVVRDSNWLDERQFLVAVAVGMVSPGPVVITATFVGFLVAGIWGAAAATVGIFLPSFLFVLIVAPLLVRHGGNPHVKGFVKGAYAAAIGTILGASVLLGRIAIGDWLTVAIVVLSLVALFRWKVSNPLLMAAAALVGLAAFPLLHPAWVFVR